MSTVILTAFFLFALGAAVGSFLNVVLYRSIIGQDWVRGRSRCETCKKQIKWYDNIPLLSYLVLGGKCRFCKESISLSHPVVEFLTGILFVWWYLWGSFFFQLTQAPFQALQPLFWLAVGILLVMVFVADMLYLIIPDVTVILLIGLTVAYRVALIFAGIMQPIDLFYSMIAMLLVFIFFAGLWFFTGGRGMGLGDVKLVVPLSLLLGWPDIAVGLFVAFILGAVFGILLIALGKRKMGQVIPFGPFLVIGTVIALLFSDQILGWYLGFI
jgi:prepilin signal peptidase PulO-like enzyme (type II secretory pathway)